MFLLYKMYKTLKVIKTHQHIQDRGLINSFNPDVLYALQEYNCIDIIRAFGGDIVIITYNNSAISYKLERSEVWVNRILGFVSGVLATALGKYLLELLK